MSARAAGILLAGLVALLLLAWQFLAGDAAEPSTTTSSADSPTTTDPEAWIESVAKHGFGHVCTQVNETEGDGVSTYVTLGALTPRGRDKLMSTLASEIEDVEAALDARLTNDQEEDGSTSLGRYEQVLKRAARLELLRARADLVRSGIYITIPLSGNGPGSVPREPPGVISATYGAYEVEGGKFAQVILWVDRDKRAVMREVNESLQEVHSARRDEWVENFNASPTEHRRAWFARHKQLSDMQRLGVSQMSNSDLAEWIALKQKMKRFSLRMSEQSLTVY